MCEVEQFNFMEMVRDIVKSDAANCTKKYCFKNYIFKLLKQEVFPNKAYQISFSYCCISQRLESSKMSFIGLYFCATDKIEYYLSKSVSTLNGIATEISGSTQVAVNTGESYETVLQKVQQEIIAAICLHLFYGKTPIEEEWNDIDIHDIVPKGSLFIDLLKSFANCKLSKETSFLDALQLINKTPWTTIGSHSFCMPDILLFYYGSDKEKQAAKSKLQCTIINEKNFSLLKEIWESYLTLKSAEDTYATCTEDDISHYQQFLTLAKGQTSKIRFVFKRDGDIRRVFSTYDLKSAILPCGVIAANSELYTFNEIIEIKQGNRFLYRKKIPT